MELDKREQIWGHWNAERRPLLV